MAVVSKGIVMLVAAILAPAFAAQVMAAPSELSPEALALIAPVGATIAQVRAKQAARPPPRDDAESLVRMGELEQAARDAVGKLDPSAIPATDRRNAMTAVWRQVQAVDQANQKALLEMVPPEGWFTITRYGREASHAAFLIVQHANPELWRRFVPVLEPLAAKGEVAGGEFALMYDRLAGSEGRPQRYGSQMTCKDGKLVPRPIEDPDRIDARRRAMGMTPYADYLASFADAPPCR